MEQAKLKTVKEFSFGEVDYVVLAPTISSVREAKYVYAKSFTDALKQGFLTKKKMESTLFLADKEIFQSYMDRRSELLKLMNDTDIAINEKSEPDELEYLAELMSAYRDNLLQEDMNLSNLFANTADQLAEDDKINFLAFSLIRKKDLSKIWQTYEEYTAQTDAAFVEVCKYQIMCLDYNLNPDWEKGLPENVAREKATQLRVAQKKENEKLEAELESKKVKTAEIVKEEVKPEIEGEKVEKKVRKKRTKKEV